MKLLIRISFLVLAIAGAQAQETLPIYQDYLSDNVYLIHPAAAGIGDCGKIRLTARTQWLGVDNAPELQTLSFHAKMNADSKAAYGAVVFNDKNGFHSQQAFQGTYAYHLEMDRGNVFNQLSFGLSLSAVQNQVDQTTFGGDPTVRQIIESELYVNADFGLGYHYKGLSSYLTIKNIFLTAKDNLKNEFDALNLRNYILGAGYFFGDETKLQYEPSFMFQFKEQTQEKILDLNVKVYKNFKKTKLWLAASFRSSFGGNTFGNAQYISPIFGVNFNRFMVSYTYTKQFGDILFSDAGFHQISLGLNVLCRKKRLAACPNINGQLF
jgi:type IX secretion system PorP/SprF family membrane protein